MLSSSGLSQAVFKVFQGLAGNLVLPTGLKT